MSNNEWVREGTPREADDWSEAQDDYGVPVEPTEWDDYSAEQRVPVPTPPAPQVEEAAVETESADVAPEAPSAPADVEAHGAESRGDDQADEAVAEPVAAAENPVGAPLEAEAPVAVEGNDPGQPEPQEAPEPEAPVEEPEAAELSEAAVVGNEPEPREAPAAPEFQAAAEETAAEPETVEPAQPESDALAHPAETDAQPEPDEAAPATETPEADPTDEVDSPADESREDESMTETRQRPLAVNQAFQRPEDAPDGAEATETLAAAGTASLAGLYREEDADRTQVIDTSAALEAEAAEEANRAEQLRLEKEARDQRLGLVATSEANASRDLSSLNRPGVNGFASFGLLVLRLVTAFVLGVAAWQALGDHKRTAEHLAQTILPYPNEIAWGLGFTLAAMAVLLVIGLGVRVVGLVLAILAGCTLAFLRWGSTFSIFVAETEGFRGDKDLILLAIGFLLFCIGGGKVGIDGAISKARWNSKLAKRA